jgi:hypothetical protein
MSEHDPGCKWPSAYPCLSFSTDGTLMGARIAHAMGTTDEAEIARTPPMAFESDVEAEQADWESDDAEDDSVGRQAG